MTPIDPVRSAGLTRRTLLAGLAAAAATTALPAQAPDATALLDTHIHLFDPRRPQGAPYTGPAGHSPQVALPPRFRELAEPLGIVGAIKVEASPWIEDNLWALQVAESDPIVVGVVGNLQPEKPEFPEYLERHHKNPLFRGIRYGNLWGYDLSAQVANPVFLDGLRLLAQADLVLDTANPNVSLLEAIVRVTDQVPDLRIVIDHLPGLEPTPATQAAYDRLLSELQQRSNVSVKLSAVIHRVNGQVSTSLDSYRERLDRLMEVFGEDRVLFGSDWPNSDGVAPLDKIVSIVQEYFQSQPRSVAEKYFWKNSVRVYKWMPRAANQPRLSS
jgi:predicted TIM-barrel fold metal-dependent hydrolase